MKGHNRSLSAARIVKAFRTFLFLPIGAKGYYWRRLMIPTEYTISLTMRKEICYVDLSWGFPAVRTALHIYWNHPNAYEKCLSFLDSKKVMSERHLSGRPFCICAKNHVSFLRNVYGGYRTGLNAKCKGLSH